MEVQKTADDFFSNEEHNNLVDDFIDKKFKECLDKISPHVSKTLNKEVSLMYLTCLLKLGDFEEIVSYLNGKENLVSEFPFRIILTLSHFYMCNFDLAMTTIGFDAPSDQNHAELHNLVYMLLLEFMTGFEDVNELIRNSKFQNAIDILNDMINLFQNESVLTAVILNKRALCLENKGDDTKAVEDLTRSYGIIPIKETIFERGRILMKMKSFTDAYADFETIKARYPNFGGVNELMEKCKKQEEHDKKFPNLYKFLNVNLNATHFQIIKALQSKALTLEDKWDGESFKHFKNAYQVLSKVDMRSKYDQGEWKYDEKEEEKEEKEQDEKSILKTYSAELAKIYQELHSSEIQCTSSPSSGSPSGSARNTPGRQAQTQDYQGPAAYFMRRRDSLANSSDEGNPNHNVDDID